ncbi:hypothetical protein BJX76DRAFT_342067 [Aspergillus varians]
MHFSTLSLGVLTLLASVHAQPKNDPFHPQVIEKPHGIDSGNTVCGGNCVADPAALSCAHKEFRPKYGCYMCCLSDDDLDDLDKTFKPLDKEDDEDKEDEE